MQQQEQIHAYELHFKETVSHHRDNIDKYNEQLQQYETLKDTLTTLPHKLSHQIMVPLGSHGMGFMPGRIVNTNEVIILAGSKYFFRTSVHHALQMIERRIKKTKQFIDVERDQVQKLFHHFGLKQELEKIQKEYQDDEIMEIREEYDEEEETKPIKDNAPKEKSTNIFDLMQDDGDLDHLFDELAKEEQMEDEMGRTLMTQTNARSDADQLVEIDEDLEQEFSKYFSLTKEAPKTATKERSTAPKVIPPTANKVTSPPKDKIGFTGTIIERQDTTPPIVTPSQAGAKVSKFKQQMMQKKQ